MGRNFYMEHDKTKRQMLVLFVLGFAIGIFLYLWNHDEVRSDKTYYIETILWRMGNYEIDIKTYLMFLLRRRLSVWFLLTIGATTLFGAWVVRLFFAWNGICFGGILTMYLYWYGGKGIFYLFFLVFPQIFFYLPAYVGLGELLIRLYQKIYLPRNYYYGERGNGVRRLGAAVQYFLLLLVAITGVFFESYVNPFVVKKMINFFL